MITIINTNTLGVSEYDISNIVDIVGASGTLYYCTPSGIYYLNEESTESVTSAIKTGEIFFGDNSPKRFPHIEISCSASGTDVVIYSIIDNQSVRGIDSTRHTEEVRGHRLPNVKRSALVLEIVSMDDNEYTLSDFKLQTIDTVVKK